MGRQDTSPYDFYGDKCTCCSIHSAKFQRDYVGLIFTSISTMMLSGFILSKKKKIGRFRKDLKCMYRDLKNIRIRHKK